MVNYKDLGLVNNIGCNGPFWTAKILLFFEIEKTSGCFFF